MATDKNKKETNGFEFHIKSEDYFGTLATIVDLMRQERELLKERHQKIIEDLVEELTILQNDYRIVKK